MSISSQLLAQIQANLRAGYVPPTKAAMPDIEKIQDKDLRTYLQLAVMLPSDTIAESVSDRFAELLDITVGEFTYGDPVVLSSEPQTMSGTVLVRNDTTASQSVNQQLAKSVTDTFTWGLTQSIVIGASTEYTVGLPAAFGAKLTMKLEITAGSSQSWTTTDTQTITVSGWVNVPPNSCIEASMVVNFEDLQFPWTAECTLSPAATTNLGDITYAMAAAWPAQALYSFLPGTAADRTASGTLTAHAGMKSEVVFSPAAPLATADTAASGGHPAAAAS